MSVIKFPCEQRYVLAEKVPFVDYTLDSWKQDREQGDAPPRLTTERCRVCNVILTDENCPPHIREHSGIICTACLNAYKRKWARGESKQHERSFFRSPANCRKCGNLLTTRNFKPDHRFGLLCNHCRPKRKTRRRSKK